MTSREQLADGHAQDVDSLRDIATERDVLALVEAFYGKVLKDDLLGPVFRLAEFDLCAHVPVMTDFWMTVLLDGGRYRRNALAPHLRLAERTPLTSQHFARWLSLWEDTVTRRHAGPVADRARVQAIRIAAALYKRTSAGSEEEPPSAQLLWPVAVATRPARSAAGRIQADVRGD